MFEDRMPGKPVHDKPVELEWDGDQVAAVWLAPDWHDQISARDIVDTVSSQMLARRPGAGLLTPDLDLIPLDRFGELAELVREYREELDEHSARRTTSQVTTRHFVSTWDDAGFGMMTGDTDWIEQAQRQEIVDELVAALTPPERPTNKTGPAERRLNSFLKEYSR